MRNSTQAHPLLKPRIQWLDAIETHRAMKETSGKNQEQYNENKGIGTPVPSPFFWLTGGNYPLHPPIPNALARSYLEFAIPETAGKLYLGVSPQEMFVGDIFTAQLLIKPMIKTGITRNVGSVGDSIQRGALTI